MGLAFHGQVCFYWPEPDHAAFYFRRRIETLFIHIKEIFHFKKSLYQHTEYAVYLISLTRCYTLRHFFLKHTYRINNILLPFQDPEKYLGGNIVWEITYNGK